MPFNDPIADLLTRIRNAKDAEHRFVDIGISKVKIKIVEILKEQGFIENFLLNKEKKKMRIFLKYSKERKSVIQGLKRISSPGLRRYVASREIPRVFNGMGISILSTSKGIIDGKAAKDQNIGGELLCHVW